MTFRSLILTLAASLIAWGGASVVFAAANPCSSSGYEDRDDTDPENPVFSNPNLYCSPNACPAPATGTCHKIGGAAPHPVFGTYSYCGCTGAGEPICCHLLLVQHGGPTLSGKWAVIGDCEAQAAACPAGNVCRMSGSGTSFDPWKSACEAE